MGMATFCELRYKYCQASDSLDFCLLFFATQKWFIFVRWENASFFLSHTLSI